MSLYRSHLKRVFDVVVCTVILITFSWIFLFIVLLFLFSYEFPVFYFQKRIGYGATSFQLYKFRTLRSAPDLPLLQRQFWLGSFLRKLSLDELPQLLNVLKGEMSLVGPRPLPVIYTSRFTALQNQRHDVRPGMTGLAQVNGRNSISWKEKFDYDIYYVQHPSFWMDLRILWKTFILLFSFKEDVSLKEKEFTGLE